MSRRSVLALVLVGAVVASACGASLSSTTEVAAGGVVTTAAPPVPVSAPGPAGVLDTTGGSTFAFEDVVGEPTVLWFWGPG